MKAQLAFYKAKGTWVDKAIRIWTSSIYSHVELVVDGAWYSTSPRDLKVRKKCIKPKEDHWDFVDVDVDEKWFYELFDNTEGAMYDWKGIFLNEFLPFRLHSRDKFYCSEWCATALEYSPAQMSPQDLWERVHGNS